MKGAARFTIGLLTLALVLSPGPEAQAGDKSVVKMAIVVGNNAGLPTHRPLRFAEDDARRMRKVLEEVGGFEGHRIRLLTGEGKESLEQAFSTISHAIEKRGEGAATMVLFYFSGHSDGTYLEMGSDRVPFAEVKQGLEQTGATLRLAIVDACLSGELVGLKGVSRAPAFELDVDGDLQTEGTVILTSAGSGEYAQETGELRGSYFTHHLVSGLYGAADADDDLSVTLWELYRYTYRRTAGDTADTLAGTQHPGYEFETEGRGDLVLSRVSLAAAVLSFPAAAKGELLLLALPSREMVAEFIHEGQRERKLFVAAGEYQLIRRTAEGIESLDFEVLEGETRKVDPALLVKSDAKLTAARGGAGDPPRAVMAFYGLTGWFMPDMGAMHSGGLLFRRQWGHFDLHVRMSYGYTSVNEDGFIYDVHAVGGAVAGLLRFPFHRFDILLGVLAGTTRLAQISDVLEERTAWSLDLGLQAAVALYLARRLALLLSWEFNYYLFEQDGGFEGHFGPRALLGVGYRF